jgi:hypothetical protein
MARRTTALATSDQHQRLQSKLVRWAELVIEVNRLTDLLDLAMGNGSVDQEHGAQAQALLCEVRDTLVCGVPTE